MEPYGTFLEAKKIKLLRFGTIWNHMEPYGTLPRSKKNKLLRFATIWNHMEPYGTHSRGTCMQKKLTYLDLEP